MQGKGKKSGTSRVTAANPDYEEMVGHMYECCEIAHFIQTGQFVSLEDLLQYVQTRAEFLSRELGLTGTQLVQGGSPGGSAGHSKTGDRVEFIIAMNRQGPGWMAIYPDERGRQFDRTVYVFEDEGPRDAATLWQALAARFATQFLAASGVSGFYQALTRVPSPNWDCDFHKLTLSLSTFTELCRKLGDLSPESVSQTRAAKIMESLQATIDRRTQVGSGGKSRRRQAAATT